MCRWPLVSCTPGTGSGGQPDLAHVDARLAVIANRGSGNQGHAGRELRISEVTTSRVGPMSAYHRILVIAMPDPEFRL
jgi:hypothetical protein